MLSQPTRIYLDLILCRLTDSHYHLARRISCSDTTHCKLFQECTFKKVLGDLVKDRWRTCFNNIRGTHTTNSPLASILQHNHYYILHSTHLIFNPYHNLLFLYCSFSNLTLSRAPPPSQPSTTTTSSAPQFSLTHTTTPARVRGQTPSVRFGDHAASLEPSVHVVDIELSDAVPTQSRCRPTSGSKRPPTSA